MEKYSVLMSLYIKEKPDYLRHALDSMINQTIKPDEIVLVEDGPLTDELYAVVEAYKDQLHLIVNNTNLGLGPALNRGLEACKNELVARMDTDDIAVLDRCEKQIRFLEDNPAITIVGGQIEEFIDDPSNITGRRIVPETDKELKAYMKKRCPFNHMTVMFKKSDVIKAGNYQDWFWNEDYFLCDKYFKSEIGIQKFMLDKKMIGCGTYLINCGKRLMVEKLMPDKLRGWVFQKFARS